MVHSLGRGERSEKIAVSRLDWLWPRVCGEQQRVDGVKIDVQGMELEVLQGMQSLLRVHKPRLILELHEGINRATVLDLLDRCGYETNGKAISVDKPISKTENEGESLAYHDNWNYLFLPKNTNLR